MNLDEFINKYIGKKIDFDGYYGGQCVDLYRQYVKEVLDYPQSPGVGGAAEIWDSASPQYYDFITNTPEGIPSKGDIVIWNRRVGGGFGHVDVFVSSQDINNFTGFDQNWPTLDVCTLTKHNYSNVIGWLHPKENMATMYKGLDLTNQDSMKVAVDIWDDVINRKLYIKLADIYARYEVDSLDQLDAKIAGLKSRATELGNENGRLQAEVDNKLEIISRREAELLATQGDVKVLMDRLEEAAQTIEQFGKDKGTLAIQVEQLKVQIETLKSGQVGGLTGDSTIKQFVDWLKNLFIKN